MPNGYFGVNDTARKIQNIYIGQNGVASQVKKAYIGDQNGVARLWYQSIVPISELPVGSVVKGIYGSEEFIIVHQGNPNTTIYPTDCNGTWIMAKDCLAAKLYNSSRNSLFTSSSICDWLNNTFYNQLTIKKYVKTATIPYYNVLADRNNAYTLNNGFSTKIFLLSAVEAGFYNQRYDSDDTSIYDKDGAKLDYFDKTNNASSKRVATYNGTAVEWWMRTPRKAQWPGYQCVKPQTNGAYGRGRTNETHGIRPVMILPNDILVDSNGTVLQQTLNEYLWDYSIGQTVKIDVNGQKLTWRIVHRGNPDTSKYGSNCNGVWLMLDALYETSHMGRIQYPDSDVDSYLNTTFYNMIGTDSNVKDYIRTATIPYVHVTRNDDDSFSYQVYMLSDGISRRVFTPSPIELGQSIDYNQYTDGAKLDYFDSAASKRIKTLNGVPTEYWTRNASAWGSGQFYTVTSSGNQDHSYYSAPYTHGVLPCIIMRDDALIKDGVIIGNE